ncbi:MAG TPA: tRNA uridine-5-carboxymethylaminomethyl(34) synthesis GTPase MnmE [Syntrophomonadaceae bacterium]|nr:tRNA uridine-5-carboxymethylaminomethyl(34) synthesis GTPase MnmE [Syntrophomonadaceae bacterium]HOQ09767.1 tRNA uridine-5-carboxymethylaminomethyl(34) synthesis GTPase MnmE [Syntrophomonadaceae bacterium]HPU48689.1 tRNA uridine-5-carboxymethylaminomethyl(34) synthesis GTPase MnmE [Syntrophomonadaceae bacterium]
MQDAIAAISTPPGEGGIAIVRLSGNKVIETVDKLFKPFRRDVELVKRPSHTLTLGWIIDEEGNPLDEVLVSIMREPHSYTGEDVVEINCHGGTLPARRVLERVLQMGIRLAEPGEFTRRAFLNGRLDASQAEAVIDIIRAKTDKAMQIAMRRLQGSTSRLVQQMEDELVLINAMVEASLDFPDEVGEPDYEEIKEKLEKIIAQLEHMLEAARRADIYRQGITVAIAGKPNVGKSSLLNALLRKERAIVTNIPGTTRDIIEDWLNIRGIPVKILDTAGIRDTEDIVEQIGVQRSREVIQQADLIIFLLDVTTGITPEDQYIYESIADGKVIVLVNKEDLEDKKVREEELQQMFPDIPVIRGSVKEEIGLEELESLIEQMVLAGGLNSDDLEMVVNLRQKQSLAAARQHLQDVLDTLQQVPLDCLGVDLQGALEALGEVTGKNLKEEVIDRIFHEFCIGK